MSRYLFLTLSFLILARVGAKLFLHRKLGIKLQAKFNPTLLNDESSDFCDPFGFCASSVRSFELLSDVVFRF